MTKEYCHLCREGGRQYIEVTEAREAALLKFNLKCSTCGKPLVH